MASTCRPWLLVLTWVLCCTLHQAQARSLVPAGPTCTIFNTSCSANLHDQLQHFSEALEIFLPAPGHPIRGWRSERAYFLEGTSINWRPLFVLGVGEVLGHIVRGVTGFGSAIVLVSFWTICTTAGLDAGPFQSLIFADSICALSTAAPLVYITKPWKFASWRLVVTLLAFQALGAPVGAYLVLRLEPAPLNFAIATALLVLFLLMVCPLEECISRMQAQAQPRPGADLTRPLLASEPGSGPKARSPWWRRWLQRRNATKQVHTALIAGTPAGNEAAPDQADAKSDEPAIWQPHGVPSPFLDSSQQQQAQQEQQPRFVSSENPLLLSRKQSDSASSLRVAGGSGPTTAIAKRRVSISEHPVEARMLDAEGGGIDSLGEGEKRGVGKQTGSVSGAASRSGLLEGGAGEDAGAPLVAEGDPGVVPSMVEGHPGRVPPLVEGVPGSSVGSVSGDSNLAQRASAEIGGVVIGIMPDSEPSHSARLVDRSASQRKAAEWSMDTRTLVGSAAVAATCSGMLSALSGIGGPPLILMFQLLAVPKRVVRATMVTTSIVSIKFFTYLFMGSAHTRDVPLYCLGIVSAYIGLNIGNALAKRMNQQAFGKVLLGVMLLSTCLLYASSFGLTER